MKEITDQKIYEGRQELERKFYSKGEIPKVEMGDYRHELPEEFLRTAEKVVKYYEADSISDIKENYRLVTKENIIPFKILKWHIEQAVKSKGYVDMVKKGLDEGIDSILRVSKRFVPKQNLNIVTIDNVYITNFQDTHKYSFDICEFEIYDIHGGTMSGMYTTRLFGHNKNESKLAKLEMIKTADGSRPFDLTVQALSEQYKDRKTKKIITLEKKLHVIDIRDPRKELSEAEVSPDGLVVDLPVLTM